MLWLGINHAGKCDRQRGTRVLKRTNEAMTRKGMGRGQGQWKSRFWGEGGKANAMGGDGRVY